jgi:hypothetical protein
MAQVAGLSLTLDMEFFLKMNSADRERQGHAPG